MQSELKACRCGRTPRLTKRDVEPQGDTWYQGRMALFVICDCGICLFDEYFHEGFSSEADAIAAWNTRAEGDADTQREGALRMYVVAFCALIEGLADEADIDLAETEMTMKANGKQLAARSVEQMIADAKKLAGVGANHDN